MVQGPAVDQSVAMKDAEVAEEAPEDYGKADQVPDHVYTFEVEQESTESLSVCK